MTSAAKAAADLASVLPMDDPLAQTARMVLESHVRTTIGQPVDSRNVHTPTYGNPIQIGTPLRDAAVDPRPEDFLPPINAGAPGPLGDPHSPHVVAIEVDSPVRIKAIREFRAQTGRPNG